MNIEYTEEQSTLQPQLTAANINAESFLATDYHNHYNEIVMLLEMIPDIPDMVEEAADWQPKSYAQHFIDSGFQATELAIQAFDMAPTPIKNSFNRVCQELDKIILSTISGLMSLNVVDRGLSLAAQDLIRQRVLNTKDLLLKLNQVVNGKIEDEDTFISSLVFEDHPEEAEDDDFQTQDDIDKLFD